jgi:spermidine synthase
LPVQRAFLVLTVFAAGMTTMAVEMSAARLLDPYFGNSLVVWANLIGLILVYLSVGYYLGGKVADRSPHARTFYTITATAAVLIGLVPFIARPILTLSVRGFADYDVGLLAGSLVGVLLLFAAPIILLGFVSPFAVRLAVRDVASAGKAAGKMYAVSTVGSILGTFTPVLVFIPAIGTRRTFWLFSAVLLATSIIGLALSRSRRAWLFGGLALLLLAAVLLAPPGIVKASEGLIYETESAYNYIQVVQWGDDVYLRLNEGQGVHSVYNPYEELTGEVWDYFLVAPYFNAPVFAPSQVRSLCLIGLAAGTVSKQYALVYGDIPMDGVEIDSEIVRVGREYFAMNEPSLRAIVQDGRYFLHNSPARYSVIAVDAYRPPYIPFHLTTSEFFQEVYDHLTDDGVAAINVGRTPSDYALVDSIAHTMRTVFPSLYVLDTPNREGELASCLVVATRQPTRLENLRDNAAHLQDARLRSVAERAMAQMWEVTEARVVFTDDRAPVEQIVHRIILDYVTGE